MTDAPGRAASGFTNRFDGPPDGVWRAPGRVNLIGEHTDYNDGFVMPFAIDRSTCVAWANREDGWIHAASEEFGDAAALRIDDLVPGRSDGWVVYVHGAIAELRERLPHFGGADIFVASDVPAGAGLSSSAALECATALAVTEALSVSVPQLDLALAAQRAEHRFAGVPCGVMDQIASISGAAGYALMIDTRTLQIELLPLQIAGHVLAVIDTRVKHSLAAGEYAGRRAACERAAEALGVPALRDATLDSLAPLDGELLKRARHVVSENARVLAAAEALRAGSLPALQEAMIASHVSLRDDYEVSSPELDLAVDAAVAAGALAARMTGGGFGGSAIAIVPEETITSVRSAVRGAFADAGYAAPHIEIVEPAAGAERVL